MRQFARDTLLGLLSIAIALALLAAGGELAIRSYHLYRGYSLEGQATRTLVLDDKLGWRARPGYRFAGERRDAAGVAYDANVSTDARGFRLFGDLDVRNKKKMLVVGDSFTHAVDVSDEMTYYAHLADALPVEMFAIGVEGYGTLQQYMLIDEIIDGIAPDILLIQFCANDFINNSFELEFASKGNNNGLRRPYLVNGEITYRIPKNYPGLREFAYRYSRLLYWIFKNIDRLHAQSGEEIQHDMSSEGAIAERGFAHAPFRESVATTRELLAMIRKRVPPTTPIYIFEGFGGQPYYKALEQVVAEADLRLIKRVPAAILATREQGIEIHAQDGAHWNNTGHRVVGEALREYFDENGLQ